MRVLCSLPQLSGESNLAFKALRLCSEIFEFQPLEISIQKNIPLQAGLGGGSSDAAATLRLLNRISGGVLKPHLDSIALACGSDVPFFLGASPCARAGGRGERLQPLEAPTPAYLAVVMPYAVQCSTAEAFAKLDALPERQVVRPEKVPYNDFERVAPVESLELIDRLASFGAEPVGLCGSGSAVYGFSPEAGRLAEALSVEGHWAVATRTISYFGEPWTP
jgi:4-diphosphocytidyl-2-C-methyl-D-erythritol kinase